MYCDSSHCASQFQFKWLLLQSCLSSWLIASDGFFFYIFSHWFLKAWKLSIIWVSYSTKFHRLTTCYTDSFSCFESSMWEGVLPSFWQSWFYKHIHLPSKVLFSGQILLDNIHIEFLAYFPAVFSIFISFYHFWGSGAGKWIYRQFSKNMCIMEFYKRCFACAWFLFWTFLFI